MTWTGEERRRHTEMETDIAILKEKIETMEPLIKEVHGYLIETRGALRFVKALSVLAVSGAALWAWVATEVHKIGVFK